MSSLLRHGVVLIGVFLCVFLHTGCEKFSPQGDPEPPQGAMPTNENPTEDFKPRP